MAKGSVALTAGERKALGLSLSPVQKASLQTKKKSKVKKAKKAKKATEVSRGIQALLGIRRKRKK